MKFLQDNILLIAVAFVSGAMLIWPYVRRATAGPSVTPAQATQLINREDALVLDVREPGEYGAGHILGARNLPLANVDQRGAELAKRKDRPVIVYCDSGNRSGKAAAALKALGYTRVLNLAGGLPAWQQAGMPVEK